jgi:hypothetical protein
MPGRADNTTHAAAVAKIAEVAQHAAGLRRHVVLIVESPEFRGSNRAQVLLKYIVERALRGECEDLRERIIGVELFGRDAGYDTGEDAIVRVAASDLRKRLAKFYENGGKDSGFRIDLPAGSYVPDFHCLESPVEPLPELAVVGEVLPSGPRVTEAQAGLIRRFFGWRGAPVLLVLVVLIASLAGWAIGRASLSPAKHPATEFVSAAFHGASRTIQVVFSDEALVQIQLLLRRRITLQEYESMSYLSAPELAQDEKLRRLLNLLSSRQIASIGDVENAYRIRENLRARGWDVVGRHARLVNARDLRSGNFILLGSSYSNPWASLFQAAESNFPLEDPRPAGKSPAFVNRFPRTGEPAAFGVELNGYGGKTVTHALVTLTDNVSHSGRVLLVAGQSLSATEMAADFLVRSESANRVRRTLGLAAGSDLPNLEMVLRVTEVNQVGDSVELAACRPLPLRPEQTQAGSFQPSR